MYPSVNLKNAIYLAASALSQSISNDCHQLSHAEWTYIFHIAHYKLEFMWNDDLWTSTNGVPIGSPVGPHLAILGLQYALQEKVYKIKRNTKYYGAYIDDHFGISSTIPTEWLPNLLPTIGQPTLFFDPPEFIRLDEMVIAKSFFEILDVKFWAVKDRFNKIRLLSDVFAKPLGAYQYLHWQSAHSNAEKKAIPKGEIIRRTRIVNKSCSITATRLDLYYKLKKRGYPSDLLIDTFVAAQHPFHQNEELLKRISEKKRFLRFPWNRNKSGLREFKHSRAGKIIPIITKYFPRFTTSAQNFRRILESQLQEKYPREMRHTKVLLAYKKHKTLLNLSKNNLKIQKLT